MSLGEHLVELRKRLMIAAIGLVVGMVIAFIVTEPVIRLITIPIIDVAALRGDTVDVQVMFTTVTSPFDLRIRIALAIGLLLSAPVWLWQVWAFIMPGLTRKEIGYTVGFVGAAVPLFFAGTVVGWFVLPHIVEIMATFAPDQTALYYDAVTYYDFVFKFFLVIGIAFVLPVFLVALNVAGVISGRDILKGWRIAVLVATIFAAVATPAADAVSMLLLAGILVVLFFAAAGVSMLFDRRRRRRESAILPPEPAS
ncbi:twin-arginine translocase subunit TatC [Microbacterium sediminicola]|uniref:Sec-independent protein translocase protein TatC n=1 Tax=Microbacterium sediminicola TaxID=415210 RepID=A0ABP4TVL4_9MICO